MILYVESLILINMCVCVCDKLKDKFGLIVSACVYCSCVSVCVCVRVCARVSSSF